MTLLRSLLLLSLLLICSSAAGQNTENLSRTRNWVTDYGAVGDGTTDDGPAFALAISKMSNGDTLFVPRPGALTQPSAFYKVTAPIVISKSIRIVGEGDRPPIKNTTTADTVASWTFDIQADNVTLENLDIQCAGGGTDTVGVTDYFANRHAIHAFGTKAGYLTGIRVRNCRIGEASFGTYFKYVRNWEIVDSEIYNCAYACIHNLSVSRGMISGNLIHDQIDVEAFGYGVAISSISTDVDAAKSDPRSEDCVIDRNFVWNCPWEGIDAHGGLRVIFSNNTVYNCPRGIVSTTESGDPGTPNYGSDYCIITGNSVDSGVTDGSALEGLLVNGTVVPGDADKSDPASVGNIVTDNVVKGYGSMGTLNSGGICFHNTRGTVCNDNYVRDCSPCGILWNVTNKDFTCTGNTIEDPWANAVEPAAALPGYGIHVYAEYNRGLISSNTLVTGNKAATNVRSGGVRITSPNCSVIFGPNNFQAITPGGVQYIDALNQGRYANLSKRITVVWDPPRLAYGEIAYTTITQDGGSPMTGVVNGDQVKVAMPSMPAGFQLTAGVPTANTIFVTLKNNLPGASIDLVAQTITADVLKKDW
jgi:hypothetical protein